MDKIYDKEFNISINIMEIINILDKKAKLDLIETLLGGCSEKKQLNILTNVLSDNLDMDSRFVWAKEVIGWLDNIKRQELINYINKLLEKQNKYTKKLSNEKNNERDN